MEKVQRLLHKNLIEFAKRFNVLLKGHNPILKQVLKYFLRSKGKQVRPLFVFLSAGIAGEINDSSYRTASMIELLHTATLVHDDVVDDAMQRRSVFSINAVWKNKIAVLVGDYLLAQGLLLAVNNEDFELLKITSNAVREMSEGEILQIEKARKLDITEEVYFEIIRSKTASLLAAACSAGAYSAKNNLTDAATFKKFGELIGIAFQIKDDLLDYQQQGTGKPSGGDIKEKKMTLPLIYTLQQVPSPLKRKIIYIIKNENTNPAKIAEVMNLVREYAGLRYAESVMTHYRDEALKILYTFPESEWRAAMEELVNFTISRNK